MTPINGQISPEGAELQVFLSPSRWYYSEVSTAQNAKPVRVRAVVDTGSPVTVVRKGIIARFGLSYLSRIRLGVPTDEQMATNTYPQYPMQIVLPNHHVVPYVLVAELPLSAYEVDFLIGRDVLRQGVFIYNGPLDAFTLCL